MVSRTWLLCLYLIIQSFSFSVAKNENERSLSTSVVSMVELLKTERFVVNLLLEYEHELKQKIGIIIRQVHKMRGELQKNLRNPEAYVSNPINAFSLIRRMQSDWLKWEAYLKAPVGPNLLRQAREARSRMPTETDLKEAVLSMRQMRMAYNLQPKQIAWGVVNGKKTGTKLTALDLYTMGFVLLKQNFSIDANTWLDLALEFYAERDGYFIFEFNKKKVFQVYIQSFVKYNDFENALLALDDAIDYNNNNQNWLQLKSALELKAGEQKNQSKPQIEHQTNDTPYFMGCAEKFPLRPHKLRCRYNTKTSAFLKLAPLKMEEISLDPYMVIYYDVITDIEIEQLRELSIKNLSIPMVYDTVSKKVIPSNYRTGQSAWLQNSTERVDQVLHQRIEDMTGLVTKGSEPLQILNYGTGGNFKNHYDFFGTSKNDTILRGRGDRKATILFYLSNVEQGGATVFPHMKFTIYPQKGAALIWHNLKSGGFPDERTLHVGCPVLIGSKWICTKWISEINQYESSHCLKG